jgi:hypothetical protein
MHRAGAMGLLSDQKPYRYETDQQPSSNTILSENDENFPKKSNNLPKIIFQNRLR